MMNQSASGRTQSPHISMFLRMLVRAAILRRGRAAAALLAMVVAATVCTTMLNLFVDMQSKLQKEFRNYGANIVVLANDGRSLPPDAFARIEATLADVAGQRRGLAVPFAYVVARTPGNQPVVVSGTDFASVRELNNWWSVSGWPTGANQALVGIRAASAMNFDKRAFDLTFEGHSIHLNQAGSVHTGGAEDSRIYISLSDFERWTGVQPSTIEISAAGPPQEVEAAIQRLKLLLPDASVRPVRQVLEAEARVLGKTKSTLLASCILIIATAALCVLSTLSGWVLDRRRDFAVMKALGASQRFISTFFAAEASLLGISGGILGFGLGTGVAAWIGRANFHAPVAPRFEVLPIVLLGSILVALAAAVLPISLLRRVQPAMILKGE